jgi:hypothetical protein
MIVPKPLEVSIKFETGTVAAVDFPSDFTISEVRGHIQLAAGMIDGHNELPDFCILHEGRIVEDSCRLANISQTIPIQISVKTRRNCPDSTLEKDCTQIAEVTRRLMEHANEDAEFAQQHHNIMENQRLAQAAVINAWSRYASSSTPSDFLKSLLPSQENPLVGYLNKQSEK